jgi:hypothetical protein
MIYIFGDSFASDNTGWPGNFANANTNHATRGSSEYRIWKNYINHRDNITHRDTLIFCHTSWSRVYLKDENRDLISRSLASHPYCDILLGDITAKREKKFIKIIEEIWDEEFQCYVYDKVISDCFSVPNSFHITFFSETAERYPLVHNMTKYRCNYPGKINHMCETGNMLVTEYLKCI